MNQTINYIHYNGNLLPESEFSIALTNRSFRYGDGIFESIKIINGIPLFYEDHLRRLLLGLKTLKISFPQNQIPDFEALIFKTCQANNIHKGGIARLIVYRNEGGKYLPTNDNANFIIETSASENDFIWSKENLNIGIYPEVVKPLNILSSIKSNNAQLFVLAAIFAQENKLDDALILNENHQIIEATSSNLFWIQDQTIHTPPLESGPLPGVMRKHILLLTRKIGYSTREICPSEEALLNADEIFLTNSISGVKAVTGFKQKRYYRNQSLKIVKELNNYSMNYILSQPDKF